MADFGLAVKVHKHHKLFQKCGTPSYIAPEMLRDQGYNTKADVFSLGSLLFNILTGKFLFGSRDSTT